MEIDTKLYELFREKADTCTIGQLCIGLAYTGVTTSHGGAGLAYTWTGSDHHCIGPKEYRNFEGENALDVLSGIRSKSPLKRSMALALINALNSTDLQNMPVDSDNTILLQELGIRKGARVAMVGYFPPLVRRLEGLGADLEILDHGKGLGDERRFYEKLKLWTEALILTSSSILNSTTETILDEAGPSVKAAMVGPSTPMVPAGFHHLPVQLLAGSMIEDREAVFRAVRHGAGTPVIGKFCRKIYMLIQ